MKQTVTLTLPASERGASTSGSGPASRKSFLGKAGPLVLARLVTAGITFCIPLVLARAMNLAEYGTYKQLFLLSQTLYYTLPFGVAQSLYFFVPRSDERRPYFGQTLVFLFFVGGLAALGIQLLGGTLADVFSNPALREHLPALSTYVAFLVVGFPLEISLTSQGKTKQSAVVYLVSDTLRAAAMVVPIALGFGLHGMMWATAGFAFLRTIAACAVMLRSSTGPLWRTPLFVRQLVYAAPFGAAMLLAIPQQYAHQYAVSAVVSPELFALYAVACFQLPIVDLLYTPTSEVLMVRLGELEKQGRLDEAVHSFREASGRLAFAFLPMAAFLFAAAPEFIGTLFGQKFLPAVPMFRVSVLAIALAILPIDGVLRARNQTRHIFLSYLVKALVSVPLVYFGVKHFGMMGGIVSFAVAEVVGKLALLLRVPEALSAPPADGQCAPARLRIRDVMPWRELGKASLAAVAAALAVFALRWLGPRLWTSLPEGFVWRTLPLAAAGVLFVVGYLATLSLTGVRVLAVFDSLKRRRLA